MYTVYSLNYKVNPDGCKIEVLCDLNQFCTYMDHICMYRLVLNLGKVESKLQPAVHCG